MTFEGESGPTPVYDLQSGYVTLNGPGGLSVPFAQLGTDSSATYSVDASGAVVLETLNLFSQGPVTASDGTFTYVVDHFAAKLHMGAAATKRRARDRISAGTAEFVASASVEGSPFMLAATPANDGSIFLTRGWYTLDMTGFTVTYSDSLGGVWTFTVSSTSWSSPPPM